MTKENSLAKHSRDGQR